MTLLLLAAIGWLACRTALWLAHRWAPLLPESYRQFHDAIPALGRCVNRQH